MDRHRVARFVFVVYSRLGWGTDDAMDYFFLRRLEWRVLRRFLGPETGDRVCDVACGSGNWARRLSSQCAEVVGVDIDRDAIALARREATENLSMVCADVHALPFPTGMFDKVLCMCSLEHFRDDELAMREIARILRPGGTCAASVDSLSHPRGLAGELLKQYMEKHSILHRYTPSELERLAAGAGLVVEEWRFIVNGRLTNWLHRLWSQWDLRGIHPYRMQLCFPVVYPLALLSDLLARETPGAILAARLRKPA